jgi:type IV secretory pathway TrbL component
MRTGLRGPAAAPINAAVGLGAAAMGATRQAASRVAGHFRARSHVGARAVSSATGGSTLSGGAATAGQAGAASGQAPWLNRFRSSQQIREGVLIAAHAVGQGDGGGASEGPNLKERS